MRFSDLANFVDRYYSKVVDACIVATLLSLWLHETLGRSHQFLLLASMVAFASVAIGAYFVRLFNSPRDEDQALAARSELTASRDAESQHAITLVVPALDQCNVSDSYRFLFNEGNIGAGQAVYFELASGKTN